MAAVDKETLRGIQLFEEQPFSQLGLGMFFGKAFLGQHEKCLVKDGET